MEPLDRDEYARRFRASRNLIVTAAQNRQRYLQQMARCIDDSQVAVEQAKRKHPRVTFTQSEEELAQARTQLLNQLPLSLIVFGRSNTGKSTLLNQILRYWPDQDGVTLFPTAGHNCSARVAVVKYGPSNEIQLLSLRPSSPMVLEQKAFTTSESIRDFMDLEHSRREVEEELWKLVQIQLPQPLLQGNLQVVDSPGMGENEVMNKVVKEFLSRLKSGIIIYVVDGMEGYKPNPDKENIKFLMEQSTALQRLIVANRIDFDFVSWFNNQELDYDLEEDPLEDVLDGLREDMGFDYAEICEQHSTKQLNAVRQKVKYEHPDYLTGDRNVEDLVIGVSAKSVKDFITNQQTLTHAPYVDSFLQLESRIAALVYENGRHHLQDAARIAQRHLMQTKTLLANFYGDHSERGQKMMELLEKSIVTLNEIFRQICLSLNSVLACDSLDLGNQNSELNRLKTRFVREDVPPEQQAIDTSLMMRESEARFMESLIRTSGGSREAKVAIRLLCDFKDTVVSRMRTILMWNFKMIFMVEANRPLSKLESDCKKLLDSLKMQSAQLSSGNECEYVIGLVSSQMLSPNPAVFDQVCTEKLTDSMRQALGSAVHRDEFRRIIDSLTPQFNRSDEERDRVLTYFMNNVDLTQQIANVITEYKNQIKTQKVVVENLLSAQLQNMRERKTRSQEELDDMRSHNEKMSAMSFYIDALVTEANWTADYEISLREFQEQLASMTSSVSPERLQRRLKPRFARSCEQHGAGATADLLLHYRLVRMQQDDARRLASDVAQVGSRLAGSVRLSWLSLADNYRAHMEEPEARLLIGFDGNYVSLAELPPGASPMPSALSYYGAS
ncbi:hypothetical protein BOX15_Mlig020050g2 [Macrostomum lignano]|uniref:Dynamin N-terminal domain-containing protein n=1 Tax=Macrostomum lignano TaxID=282301 RepID=A0A267DE22_9PLAT|nr:hypothetical protein BOX15_Mlig020050g2 [Macrostomum lignano]